MSWRSLLPLIFLTCAGSITVSRSEAQIGGIGSSGWVADNITLIKIIDEQVDNTGQSVVPTSATNEYFTTNPDLGTTRSKAMTSSHVHTHCQVKYSRTFHWAGTGAPTPVVYTVSATCNAGTEGFPIPHGSASATASGDVSCQCSVHPDPDPTERSAAKVYALFGITSGTARYTAETEAYNNEFGYDYEGDVNGYITIAFGAAD